MADQIVTKIVVKNLPVSWTSDHLRDFLEVVTSLMVADNGIQVFRNITHTALLTLEEPVSKYSLKEEEEKLAHMPFKGLTLQIVGVASNTSSVLVTFTDPDLTHDHFVFYFDNPAHSGCRDAEVKDCEIYLEIRTAVIHFSLPEAVKAVIAKGNHVLKKNQEALKVEPWYEQFHRPLLEKLITGTRPKVNPPVAPKPKLPSPGHMPYTPATFPRPSLDQSEMEMLRREMERLRLENMKLKSTEAEKMQKADDIQRHKTENERLKSENEKLKKQASIRCPVPSYHLRLLADFAKEHRDGCKVSLLEQEEVALFHGIEEDCEEAQREFLMHIQKLSDDSILLSDSISKILMTAKGKVYLEDMMQRYPGCAAKVHESHLYCAALQGDKLEAFKEEFQRNMICWICKVPSTLTSSAQFLALKSKLETEYMVLLSLPTGLSEDVQLDGINGDVEMVAREIDQFTNLNRSDSKLFHIPGTLQGTACKKWFSWQLDEVKQLILKNGEIEEESADGGYTLTFQCRCEILPSVLEKLNAIKDGIISVKMDLNKEFPKYSERALVINGLHGMGVSSFCLQLTEKLKEWGLDSIGDFKLPDMCPLPQFRLKGGKGYDHGQRRSSYYHQRPQSHTKCRGGSRRHSGQRRSSEHHKNYPALPCSFSVGGTTITIKSGDITSEQVGAAVCVVGQDLSLKGTAIGSAFLKKCPSLAQTLQTNGMAEDDDSCRLVATPTTGGNLPMPFLFHAVLNKLPQDAVRSVVKELVQQSLELTVQNGQTSIALPPFGVGRRFGFGEYTTASMMAFAIKEYLQAYPSTLQSISVVVYDTRLAGKFAQILMRKLGAAETPNKRLANKLVQILTQNAVASQAPSTPTTATSTSAATQPALQPASPADDVEENSSDTCDTDTDCDIILEEQEVPDLPESDKELFEAEICTAQVQDCKHVIDVLLSELKTTFLWHETLSEKDLDTFYKLDHRMLEDILKTASKSNVHFSVSEKELRLCGQKDNVHQLVAEVRKILLLHVLRQSSQGWDRRSRLGLPLDTDRLPSYWKVCRKEKDHTVSYSKALDEWKKRGVKLNSITKEEQEAVTSLVLATWEAQKAGAGKDARNLSHTNVQVIKVARLENPHLWQQYSHRREQLFQRLEHHHTRPSTAFCTPIDKLKGSRGPLQTTANIAKDGPLNHEIYEQVNEHYLFHGTKKDILNHIFRQGLDFRMASSRTMLGSGVYSAESSTKADQYTDFKQSRTSGEELTIILMRVLLGEPFIHKEQNPQPFKRPPCMSCSQRECSCVDSFLFDSIIDDTSRIFREFVVYDQSVCYPEYIITYKRV